MCLVARLRQLGEINGAKKIVKKIAAKAVMGDPSSFNLEAELVSGLFL